MKSGTSILCSILLLSATSASACGPFIWDQKDYNMPRIFDAGNMTVRRSQSDALFADWKALTGEASVYAKDIEVVVNGYSVNEIRKILSTRKPSNSFAMWILRQNRSDVVDYLVIAKECEQARSLHNSRWYYPSKEDGVEMTLEDIRDVCVQRAGQEGQLASRYALQAIRAMTTLGDYDGIDSLWNVIGNGVPDGVIRDMCLGYVTRSKFEHGFTEKAIEEYSKAGDISSVAFCLHRMGRNSDWLDLLEYVARYCPNNDYAPKTLQDWFVYHISDGYGWNAATGKFDDRKMIERDVTDRLCRMCDIAVSNSDCQNPAMWLYCKALALEFNDRPKEAQKVNRQAAAAVGTDFIWNSIRVLDMWLDARTATYDKEYEARLLRDLQWLDGMIVSNLTDEVRRMTFKEGWHLQINVSYYYWNDMLKKILLGEVCPRLVENGKEVLAIRLANMADNRLLGLVSTQFRNSAYNDYDYCNGLFELMNHEVKPVSIEKYVSSLDRPSTALDSFLDARGYTDKAYFLDVAGTRYIRDRKYAKAVEVLEQVPTAYQYRLNTAAYMGRDPFQVALNENGGIYSDYKLNFARRMAEYERTIAGNYGPDEKGCAKIRMGIGMRAAASFAWALTEYSYSNASYWFKTDNFEKADAVAQTLIKQGLAQIRDREVKAQELLNLQLRLEVVQNYKGTLACMDILRHCDEYSDYK